MYDVNILVKMKGQGRAFISVNDFANIIIFNNIIKFIKKCVILLINL